MKYIILIFAAGSLFLGIVSMDFTLLLLSIILFLVFLISKKNIDIKKFIKSIKFKINNFKQFKKSSDKKEFKKTYSDKAILIIVLLNGILFFLLNLFLKSSGEANLLFDYFKGLQKFSPYFLLILIFPSLLIYLRNHIVDRWKKVNLKKLILYFIFSFLGFPLGLIFFIAYIFLQVNNPFLTSVGAITNATSIERKIIEERKVPYLINFDKKPRKKYAIALLINKSNENLFIGRMYKELPDSFYIFTQFPNSNLVLVKNRLFVSTVTKPELEKIAPVMAKIMIENYFDGRTIKDHPKYKFVGRQEYLKLREKKINEEIAEVQNHIDEAQVYLNTLYSYINQAKKNIDEINNLIPSSIAKRDSDYNTCKTAVWIGPYTGTRYRLYSDGECENLKSQWDVYITQLNQDLQANKDSLTTNQADASLYEEIKEYLIQARDLMNASKTSTPYELGIFEPENNITVALDSSNPKSITDLLSTIVHEYLHYTSYVSEERQIDRFFEEGLTEYYARKIIEKETGINTGQGYPVISKIIEKMMKDLPEKEVENYYFNKSQLELVALLDENYGRNFYKDTEYYFFSINYLTPRDSLKIANNIMLRIKGEPLTTNDLESKESSLN